ncbi:CLUMA_CG002542, isoform A [Clunio marinus]|uniref:CLUMA_CG002542, isoform A n=1 Tax=Clunio marinus TaxID=568069 RepID=A0A1J1HQM1_9DIPT|nr:CLUMA_CG002542, isoform A [Clunio marinus]
MVEGDLQLSVPQPEFFDKSPMHTPSKVLKNLDLLSVNGLFVPKPQYSPSNASTAHSSLVHSPAVRRFHTQTKELRRKSVVSGEIPSWINGSLLRNGPGSIKVGDMIFNHLFDASALLHRFNIVGGKVTYQCRFLKSETYKKNLAANRIVVSEFGTSSVPDPCQSIFEKVATLFKPAEANSDNAMISIYPFNDEYFAFTESPIIHQIDPETLETLDKVNLSDEIGIVNHTSHPHVMPDGTVFNLGMSVSKSGPAYNIICFPQGERMFENARIVAEVPTRWKLHPSYMHTFGITENFFIIVEQPLTVSVPAVIKSQLTNEPMISCLKWFPDKLTYIYLIDRDSGELKFTFHAEAFFYLHIINQFEKDDHVVLDISCYRDPEMLNCMYIDSMKDMQNNPDYAKMFRGRPLRFVLPLNRPKKPKSLTSLKIFFSKSLEDPNDASDVIDNNNLVMLKDSEAAAFSMPDGSVFCKPELLCDLGCETPRINYEKNLGLDYQFFYAISSDVDLENPGTLIKVDVKKKTKLTWCENNCYPSEPIFVQTPESQDEDDGVILASLVWGNGDENRVGLLVLDAKTMTEIGRCEFKDLPGPFYTFVEFPVIHQINPTTLETENTVKVLKYVKGLVYHTSHPHVMPDGTVFNLGLSVSLTGPKYKIFGLKTGEKCFENAQIVAEVPVRWKFNPGYMHTFGVTENFFIIVEQPLTISVAVKLKKNFKKTTVSELMKWSPKENCRFCVVNRQTGKVEYEFESEAFTYFHIINQYEKDNHIVIDICCLSDASVLNKLYLESIKELEKESDLLKITLAKPFRFVLPLCNVKILSCKENENLVTLPNTKASAYVKSSNGMIFCVPEPLSDSRCELPRINYENYLGKEYKFVYGVSFEKDNSNSLIKIDVVNKTSILWTESNCYPSEPIFVPSPNSKSEDDGIVLAALLWGGNYEKRVGLLVLNAVTMKELGRCEFRNMPSPVPKCFHGWFAR